MSNLIVESEDLPAFAGSGVTLKVNAEGVSITIGNHLDSESGRWGSVTVTVKNIASVYIDVLNRDWDTLYENLVSAP